MNGYSNIQKVMCGAVVALMISSAWAVKMIMTTPPLEKSGGNRPAGRGGRQY